MSKCGGYSQAEYVIVVKNSAKGIVVTLDCRDSENWRDMVINIEIFNALEIIFRFPDYAHRLIRKVVGNGLIIHRFMTVSIEPVVNANINAKFARHA